MEENVNIRVYALHPGVVKTNLYEHVWSARFLGNLVNFLYVVGKCAINYRRLIFLANCNLLEIFLQIFRRKIKELIPWCMLPSRQT